MYKSNCIDEEKFSNHMNRLKEENVHYKKVVSSKEYKIGHFLNDFVSSLGSLSKIKKIIETIDGKLRWRNVCKKFPIYTVAEEERDVNYFSEEKFIVYTAIFGQYDQLQEPLFSPDNCEFVVITDQEIKENSVWKKYNLNQINDRMDGLSDIEKNRFCKMFPHIVFPTAQKTIYIDGNIKVVTDLTEFINIEMPFGIMFHAHKARRCVYDEIEACRILKKANKKDLNIYKERLHEKMFPKDYGMVECNVIIRDNSSIAMRNLMEMWWEEFTAFDVKRDQLSMPYILWKNNILVKDVSKLGNNVANNKAIRVLAHR